MAGRTLPINRSRTSLDQERENFEKNQTLAISKAVSDIEAPVKAKHVRSAIIGTFQVKGSHTFWSIIMRLPVHSNPIIAWKFCHTLHKVLREGHPNVLKDSQHHKGFLVDNGKLWGHLKEGYGRLIQLYCRLLISKLDFHRKNPRFPGNLMIKDEELELACEHDINLYFQLTVELLDYMDEILALQAAVFGSLDMSRSNSMTNAGQCRLAPLIPCIQDSSQVYDFIVKLLFKLHNCLQYDTLEGHRSRFLKQFKALRQFYLQSSTLQYFKMLIQVPSLDESPPNFSISSELSRHVTPIVILPNEVSQTPQVDETLIQLDTDLTDQNGSSPDLLFERDRYIEHLLHQLEQLSAELKKVRSDYYQDTTELRQEMLNLELRLSEKETEIQEALKQKEEIERKLSEAAQSAHIGSVVQLQLDETEKRAKVWEEKFLKLKDVYQKLRDEHIQLLRQKAEVDKKLAFASTSVEESSKIHCELQDSLELCKASLKSAEEELNTLKLSKDEEIHELVCRNRLLQATVDQLNTIISGTEQKVVDIEKELRNVNQEKNTVLIEMQLLRSTMKTAEEEHQQLVCDFEQVKFKLTSRDEEFSEFKAMHDERVRTIEDEKTELLVARDQLKGKIVECEKQNQIINDRVSILENGTENLVSEIAKLEIALQTSEKNSQTLNEKLNEAADCSKRLEEDYNAYKLSKEGAIRDLNTQVEQLRSAIIEKEGTLSELEIQAKSIDNEKVQLQKNVQELLQRINAQSADYDLMVRARKTETVELLHQLFIDCSVKAEQYLKTCVSELTKPAAFSLSLQDYSGFSTKDTLSLMDLFAKSLTAYCLNDQSEDCACSVIPLIFPFAQSIGFVLLHGQQLAHSIPDIEKADELVKKCVISGNTTILLFQTLQQQLKTEGVELHTQEVGKALCDLDKLMHDILESLKCNSDQSNVGEELENELGAMERAIEEAATRMAILWNNSKKTYTGVKLEVNEKVLDSCTALMKAIVELIRKAKILQEEIVARGKGSASAREFYKRNHRWTEGLLSAAKAVGFGAKLLTDAADNVVKGQAKFEQLTVASQEIAASTAQLVFASRVKAELQSKNLQALAESSRAVSLATGAVVATAKHCAELIEDSTVLDFAHLTLHQAKRLEMDSQVKVLEYESLLEKERLRLSALRKQHYQLAGETDA